MAPPAPCAGLCRRRVAHKVGPASLRPREQEAPAARSGPGRMGIPRSVTGQLAQRLNGNHQDGIKTVALQMLPGHNRGNLGADTRHRGSHRHHDAHADQDRPGHADLRRNRQHQARQYARHSDCCQQQVTPPHANEHEPDSPMPAKNLHKNDSAYDRNQRKISHYWPRTCNVIWAMPFQAPTRPPRTTTNKASPAPAAGRPPPRRGAPGTAVPGRRPATRLEVTR